MSGGIYVIRNRINGHEYVGKTTNFQARWKKHRSQLGRRVHPNPHLTYAWHYYGPTEFEFVVLETVTDMALLDERERYWGELLEPVYNIEDFGPNRISTIAPYRYSDNMAARVRLAFDELVAEGALVTPEAIRKRAGCSRGVVKMVLKDADWWTPELRRVARRNRAFPRVIRAYQELMESGSILTLSDIAKNAGTTRGTALRILRDEGFWTLEMSQEALSNSAKRAWLLHPEEMSQAPARGRQYHAELGFPNLVKGRATIRNQEYVALKAAGAKGRERLRELGYPNAQASVERQRSEGFPALARGREMQAATGWATFRSMTTDRNQAVGEENRKRVLEALEAGAAVELITGSLSMSGLGKRLGIEHHTVVKHVRSLVHDGLVDAAVLDNCHTGWHPNMRNKQSHDADTGQFKKSPDL